MTKNTLFTLIAFSLLSVGVQAAPIIGLPPDGGTGNCFPFGCTGTRYQQVYSAAGFSGSITITDITFYNTTFTAGTIAPGTYTLHLSTTSAAVDALSSTFASNVGANDALFAVYAGGGSASPSFTIAGTGFTYDSTMGNLLLDIFVANSGSGTVYLDARNGTAGGIFSRMHDFGTGFEGFGLVTGFNEGGSVPEPGTYAMIVGGLLVLMAKQRRRKA